MANSLSTRLTYRIMAVVLVMMTIIAGLVYYTVRKYMINEAKERYLNILLENQQELRRRLSDVYVAARNNVHDIERDIDDPDKMFDHLERLVKINPNIVCSSLMFERNYYPSKGLVEGLLREQVVRWRSGTAPADHLHHSHPRPSG